MKFEKYKIYLIYCMRVYRNGYVAIEVNLVITRKRNIKS